MVAPDLFVNNNVHKPSQAGTQEIHAYGADSWYVVADHARTDVPPGSIKSYPCTQRNFKDRTVDSFTEIVSTFSATLPPVGEWVLAYDVWWGRWGGLTGELMVWPDNRYNGPLPPRGATESETVTIDGVEYVAWRRPLNKDDPRWYMALAMTDKRPSGTVNLLAIFRWLVDKGWVKGADLVAAIEFGVEIANTITPAGAPQTFRLNNYTLTAH